MYIHWYYGRVGTTNISSLVDSNNALLSSAVDRLLSVKLG